MTVEQAANFLVGSLLVCIGLIIISMTIIFVNNMIHLFWKRLDMFTWIPTYESQQHYESEVKNENGAKAR
jgi:hypothetical protein